ncbi:hypothetical protein J8I32_02295 [Cupriavidus sp. AcVe19-1a]|nr:hypothetical protein [Cupriavidus sp. AcVe19-1a]
MNAAKAANKAAKSAKRLAGCKANTSMGFRQGRQGRHVYVRVRARTRGGSGGVGGLGRKPIPAWVSTPPTLGGLAGGLGGLGGLPGGVESAAMTRLPG